MKKRGKLITILAALMLLVGGYFFYQRINAKTETTDAKSSGEISVTLSNTFIDEQEKLEAKYINNFNSNTYTFDNMKVIQDPYGTSPLTALAMFTTEQATKISIEVAGKDAASTIKNSDDTYETTHEVQILGLYAAKTNQVTITATAKDGTTQTKTLAIKTKALPSKIPTVTVKTANTAKMALGDSTLTFVTPSTKYSYGFDTNGDIRWYSTRYNSHIFKILSNGHLLFLTKENNASTAYNNLLETDFIGKVYKDYVVSTESEASEEGDKSFATVVHHDAIELPNGNLLLTVNDDDKYIEDTLIEINRNTGKIVKKIDFKDILPSSFYEDYTSTTRSDGKIDWLHNNAVTYDESDGSIIVSSRSQDMVMKIDYKTTQIKWILADSTGWPASYQKYLLTPTSSNFKYPAGQHAPVILPDQDNNPDTIDILLYDNNVVVTRGDESKSGEYSAGTQYRINEKTNKVTQIWSYGEALGATNNTNVIGSARYLANGNRLINFGYLEDGKASSVHEVTESGDLVFEADISGFPTSAWSYRSERFSLYGNGEENKILK